MPLDLRRPHPAALAVLSAAVLCLLLAGGCKKEDGGTTTTGGPTTGGPTTTTTTTTTTTPPASTRPSTTQSATAAPAAATQTFNYNGVTFEYPGDWKAEKAPEEDGVDLRPPVDNTTWQPGVYIDTRPSTDADLATAMDAAVTDLTGGKTGFHLVGKKVLTSPARVKYARIEYTSLSPEQLDPLTQWHVIIPLGGGKDLTIRANALTATWPKYESAFGNIVDSIRLPKK